MSLWGSSSSNGSDIVSITTTNSSSNSSTSTTSSTSSSTCCLAPSLSRHDLFHGHLFIAKHPKGVGLLLHAREYPMFDPLRFPIDLGSCQRDSTLAYSQRSMDLRNILFFEVRRGLRVLSRIQGGSLCL